MKDWVEIILAILGVILAVVIGVLLYIAPVVMVCWTIVWCVKHIF